VPQSGVSREHSRNPPALPSAITGKADPRRTATTSEHPVEDKRWHTATELWHPTELPPSFSKRKASHGCATKTRRVKSRSAAGSAAPDVPIMQIRSLEQGHPICDLRLVTVGESSSALCGDAMTTFAGRLATQTGRASSRSDFVGWRTYECVKLLVKPLGRALSVHVRTDSGLALLLTCDGGHEKLALAQFPESGPELFPNGR
jgi:hypothetical protein